MQRVRRGLHESHRHTTWSRALRSFVVRYAVVNALSSCKSLGLVKWTESMWNFQKGVVQDIVGPLDRGEDVGIHVPVCHGRQYVCKHCNAGRTQWMSFGCQVALHVHCFAPYYGIELQRVEDT